MEYSPYKEYDLYDMINEPRRISKDPYKLHAAFMLSCLFEACPTDEDDHPMNPNGDWGWSIPVDILNDVLRNANEQFVDACDNGLQVDIWNSQYTIRHAKDIDRSRLNDIFKFEKVDDNYIVSKNGIMDLAHLLQGNQASKTEQLRKDRDYLKKIVKLAEDTITGWFELTDIEVTAYLWYLYVKSYKDNNYDNFRKVFKNDIYTTLEDDKSCWNDKMLMPITAPTPYIFSAEKMARWNAKYHQHSHIDEVDTQSAEDYWFSQR